jgi:hypothetical protein
MTKTNQAYLRVGSFSIVILSPPRKLTAPTYNLVGPSVIALFLVQWQAVSDLCNQPNLYGTETVESPNA